MKDRDSGQDRKNGTVTESGRNGQDSQGQEKCKTMDRRDGRYGAESGQKRRESDRQWTEGTDGRAKNSGRKGWTGQ